MSTALQQRW